jgi:hypothetical protein
MRFFVAPATLKESSMTASHHHGSEPSHVTSRPSVVYNLERGSEHSRPPSRVRQLMGSLGNFFDEWSWQSIILWMLALLVVIGLIVEYASSGLISGYVKRLVF